jgi:hypothetical protein
VSADHLLLQSRQVAAARCAQLEAHAIEQLCRESFPSKVIEGTKADDLWRELGDSTSKGIARFLFCGHANAPLKGSTGAARATLGFTNAQGGLDLVQPDTLAEILEAYAPSKGGSLLSSCSLMAALRTHSAKLCTKLTFLT